MVQAQQQRRRATPRRARRRPRRPARPSRPVPKLTSAGSRDERGPARDRAGRDDRAALRPGRFHAFDAEAKMIAASAAAGGERGDGVCGTPGIDQRRVDLVGQQPHLVPPRELGHGGQFVRAEHAAGRVVRVAQQVGVTRGGQVAVERRPDRAGTSRPRRRPAARCTTRRPGRRDHGEERRVGRRVHHHPVAGLGDQPRAPR